MKKILSLILLIDFLGLPIFCNDNKIQLKLDTDITKIIEQLGEPKSISVEEFTSNTNFDTICYEYEHVKIYTYRITQVISKIKLLSNEFLLCIDDKILTCETDKKTIDILFSEGSFDGKASSGNEYYYYPLTNLREIEVLYDKSFKAIEILYGYSTP